LGFCVLQKYNIKSNFYELSQSDPLCHPGRLVAAKLKAKTEADRKREVSCEDQMKSPGSGEKTKKAKHETPDTKHETPDIHEQG